MLEIETLVTRPLVKICGITNVRDALGALTAGADLLGFVCDENSPRYVTPDDYRVIAEHLPPGISRVGVFDRATGNAWREEGAAQIEKFDFVQYYDDHVWPDVIKQNWDMRRKIKAFSLSRAKQLHEIAAYNGLVQAYLINVNVIEAGHQDAETYGWDLAREAHQFGKKLYLTGGLTVENVHRAAMRVTPSVVDVTVGVESEPGMKDHGKMRAFIQAVKGRGII